MVVLSSCCGCLLSPCGCSRNLPVVVVLSVVLRLFSLCSCHGYSVSLVLFSLSLCRDCRFSTHAEFQSWCVFIIFLSELLLFCCSVLLFSVLAFVTVCFVCCPLSLCWLCCCLPLCCCCCCSICVAVGSTVCSPCLFCVAVVAVLFCSGHPDRDRAGGTPGSRKGSQASRSHCSMASLP